MKSIEDNIDSSEENLYDENGEVDVPINSMDFSQDSNLVTYVGYIGDYPVYVNLGIDYSSNATFIGGYYNYGENQKENRLSLIGRATDWYGGDIYTVDEIDGKKDTTGKWTGLRMNYNGVFEGLFEAVDSDASYEIFLVEQNSGKYIEPISKKCFDSKIGADNFFTQHNFTDNLSAFSYSGLIMANSYSEDNFGLLLTDGLSLYQHDGGDGFGLEKVGEIDSEGKLAFNSNSHHGEKVISMNDYPLEEVSIGYEEYALRYTRIEDEDYVMLSREGYDEFYLSIHELIENNYHLEDDGYWLKKRSGQVLGYFPTQEYLEIKASQNDDAETLLKVENDEFGFFNVIEVKDGWINVRFEYHENVPCSDEIREPKPAIEGWVRLYYYEKYKSNLTLDFYAKGC